MPSLFTFYYLDSQQETAASEEFLAEGCPGTRRLFEEESESKHPCPCTSIRQSI